jgi:TetR/AcrR family transcriptional repressor of mexJK operon
MTMANTRDHLAGRLGRPKDTAKRAAILDAARALFARQPFEQVTMEAVAAQAGVSKMTVYSHFHDKETLFETFVSATADMMIGALPAEELGGNLNDRIATVGRAFLGVVVGSDLCTTKHTLPLTMRANRPLAERFYAAGPERVRSALAAIIISAAGRGELTVDDPYLAADDLVSLWTGSLPDRIAFGLAEAAGPEEVRRMAARGTAVFLRAYGRRL